MSEESTVLCTISAFSVANWRGGGLVYAHPLDPRRDGFFLMEDIIRDGVDLLIGARFLWVKGKNPERRFIPVRVTTDLSMWA
jgi:hypothetical protein